MVESVIKSSVVKSSTIKGSSVKPSSTQADVNSIRNDKLRLEQLQNQKDNDTKLSAQRLARSTAKFKTHLGNDIRELQKRKGKYDFEYYPTGEIKSIKEKPLTYIAQDYSKEVEGREDINRQTKEQFSPYEIQLRQDGTLIKEIKRDVTTTRERNNPTSRGEINTESKEAFNDVVVNYDKKGKVLTVQDFDPVRTDKVKYSDGGQRVYFQIEKKTEENFETGQKEIFRTSRTNSRDSNESIAKQKTTKGTTKKPFTVKAANLFGTSKNKLKAGDSEIVIDQVKFERAKRVAKVRAAIENRQQLNFRQAVADSILKKQFVAGQGERSFRQDVELSILNKQAQEENKNPITKLGEFIRKDVDTKGTTEIEKRFNAIDFPQQDFIVDTGGQVLKGVGSTATAVKKTGEFFVNEFKQSKADIKEKGLKKAGEDNLEDFSRDVIDFSNFTFEKVQEPTKRSIKSFKKGNVKSVIVQGTDGKGIIQTKSNFSGGVKAVITQDIKETKRVGKTLAVPVVLGAAVVTKSIADVGVKETIREGGVQGLAFATEVVLINGVFKIAGKGLKAGGKAFRGFKQKESFNKLLSSTQTKGKGFQTVQPRGQLNLDKLPSQTTLTGKRLTKAQIKNLRSAVDDPIIFRRTITNSRGELVRETIEKQTLRQPTFNIGNTGQKSLDLPRIFAVDTVKGKTVAATRDILKIAKADKGRFSFRTFSPSSRSIGFNNLISSSRNPVAKGTQGELVKFGFKAPITKATAKKVAKQGVNLIDDVVKPATKKKAIKGTSLVDDVVKKKGKDSAKKGGLVFGDTSQNSLVDDVAKVEIKTIKTTEKLTSIIPKIKPQSINSFNKVGVGLALSPLFKQDEKVATSSLFDIKQEPSTNIFSEVRSNIDIRPDIRTRNIIDNLGRTDVKTKQNSTVIGIDNVITTPQDTRPIITPTPFEPLKEKPVIIPRPRLKFRKEKARVGAYQGLVKHQGKFIKAHSKPLSFEAARSKAAEVVDNSTARTFKVKKLPTTIKAQSQPTKPFESNKFYKKQSGVYVEKNKAAIDSLGELRGITAKGVIANQRAARSRGFSLGKTNSKRNDIFGTNRRKKKNGIF